MASVTVSHPRDDHLGPALLLATLLHGGLIFGIGFEQPRDAPASPDLEITLAQHRSNERPEDAEYLAAHDQLGSGDRAESAPITTDQKALIEATELRDVDPLPLAPEQGQTPPAPAQPLIGTRDGPRREQAEPDADRPRLEPTAPPVSAVREIASLRARLDQQKQAYSKIPRTLVLTAASARSSEQADYLYRWIEWVETIGNRNYPEEARRKALFGELRLAVAIGRDGEVENIEILKSSGQRVLDQAAVRIVRLAAPFAPIPRSISADRIEVIRTWRFIPGQGLATDGD